MRSELDCLESVILANRPCTYIQIAAGDKPINYPVPDQMLPYPPHSIYPSVSYPVDDHLSHAPGNLTPSDVSPSVSPPNGQVGSTKYSTQPPGDRIASALSIEEQKRLAAEEDKRRRNTAASARFRLKKKQREQALERTVKEVTEMNANLEARVAQLEMENRWLRNLLTEKQENIAARQMAASSENSTASTQQQQQQQQQQSTSVSESGSGQTQIQPKKGVGTDT